MFWDGRIKKRNLFTLRGVIGKDKLCTLLGMTDLFNPNDSDTFFEKASTRRQN
jgi:hypothetical protein